MRHGLPSPSAMQRLPLGERWKIATAMAAHEEDAGEPALPLLVWYGIEPAVATDATRAARLAISSRLPRLQQYIARRLTEEIDSNRAAVAATVSSITSMTLKSAKRSLAQEEQKEKEIRRRMMQLTLINARLNTQLAGIRPGDVTTNNRLVGAINANESKKELYYSALRRQMDQV